MSFTHWYVELLVEPQLFKHAHIFLIHKNGIFIVEHKEQ